MRVRLKKYSDAHRRLVEIAIQTFDSIKSGNIGLSGATANLHLHTLTDRSLPAMVLLSEATTVASR
jgi:hypothetical protein